MGKKRKREALEPPAAIPASKKQQKTTRLANTKAVAVVTPPETTPFIDDARGEDLKREVRLYDLLSSEDESERLSAANAVVSGLLGESGVQEATLQRHLERRLFRGLASGRKGARLGFSVVLTEILAQLFGRKALATTKYTGLTFDTVLGFLVAKTKPDGDLSGQEEKDHHLGMLFGLQSFVRAKVLFSDDERWNIILDKSLGLSKKKPWIREECGWVIMEALPQMSQIQAESTLAKLLDSGLALSPEGVGIWLTARSRFPDMKFPSKPWGQTGNPLEHLKLLGKALKESSSHDDGTKNSLQANQTGNWNPKLHFIWDVVLTQYAKTKDGEIKSDFQNFWKVAVDENLFSATASRERKFWGFLLFQKLILNYQTFLEFLPLIFSHNLMRCLINHLQDKDRFLNRAADKSIKTILQAVEAEPGLLVIFLPQLIGGYGAYNFDKVTKTKTVEKLLNYVSNKNAVAIIEDLVEPALSVVSGDADDSEDTEIEIRRLVLGDYLLNIVRNFNPGNEPIDASWIKESALPAITNFAYGSDNRCRPPLSEKTRILFRNRLMSAFGHLLSDLKAYEFSCELLLSFSPDGVEMDEAIEESKDRAISTMEKILKKSQKATDEDKPPLQALGLLYSLVIFQLYNGESEAIAILDELKLCYDKLIRHKDTGDSDTEAPEILVELLLSFISKPSALLRKVTQYVFSAFMSDMTDGGLKLMTDILESNESLRGQQELFDQDPEDDEEFDIDGEDGDMDSDVEILDMNGDEGTFNGHLDEDGDDSETDEDSGEDEEEDEDAKKLDDALAKALGTHRLGQDEEAEPDSDADMTDSEMMELDSKLVEIFSQRKKAPNKKQEQKDAKETMVNFKSRVLDLLEIYVKKQAANALAFGLLMPLLQLIRTTKTKQLAEKAHSIINSFAKAYKTVKNKEAAATLSISEQTKLLKAIHLEASKDPSHSFAKAASTSSLLVASSMYSKDVGSVKKIATVYRDSQIAWVEGEVKIQAAFFVEWVNWCQSHANST